MMTTAAAGETTTAAMTTAAATAGQAESKTFTSRMNLNRIRSHSMCDRNRFLTQAACASRLATTSEMYQKYTEQHLHCPIQLISYRKPNIDPQQGYDYGDGNSQWASIWRKQFDAEQRQGNIDGDCDHGG
jgi:hypothetical protein